VRNLSLAKGGTSKKRPSPHLHKVPTRYNKANPLTLQTALVFWLRNLEGSYHSEDLVIDVRIILQFILGWDVVDWMHLAQDGNQSRAVVNTVMNLRVP
jgi:hypothetical protein